MLNCSDVKKMYFNKTAVENISLSLENGRRSVSENAL